MKCPAIKNHLLSLSILCGSLLLSTLPTCATVADGVYAYEKGNYQKARAEWLPYAALGNPNALYNLGQLSRMGRGGEIDYSKAEDYYLRAAEKGHVGAQRNLGTLYYFGRVGKTDHARALTWLTKAAINDDARSQLMIGTMYFNGEAGKKDNVKAYAWILLASQSGLRKAKDALEKLNNVMTPDQVKQAKGLAPDMITRQLTPDDVGLMVKQQEANTPDRPLLGNTEPEKTGQTLQADLAVPATEAVPTASSMLMDNFRVQLGSFRTEAMAQKALKAVRDKLSYIIEGKQGKIEFVDLGEKGVYYRLQLSPFENRPDASELCSRLKESGQPCYVVKTQ